MAIIQKLADAFELKDPLEQLRAGVAAPVRKRKSVKAKTSRVVY